MHPERFERSLFPSSAERLHRVRPRVRNILLTSVNKLYTRRSGDLNSERSFDAHSFSGRGRYQTTALLHSRRGGYRVTALLHSGLTRFERATSELKALCTTRLCCRPMDTERLELSTSCSSGRCAPNLRQVSILPPTRFEQVMH